MTSLFYHGRVMLLSPGRSHPRVIRLLCHVEAWSLIWGLQGRYFLILTPMIWSRSPYIKLRRSSLSHDRQCNCYSGELYFRRRHLWRRIHHMAPILTLHVEAKSDDYDTWCKPIPSCAAANRGACLYAWFLLTLRSRHKNAVHERLFHILAHAYYAVDALPGTPLICTTNHRIGSTQYFCCRWRQRKTHKIFSQFSTTMAGIICKSVTNQINQNCCAKKKSLPVFSHLCTSLS